MPRVTCTGTIRVIESIHDLGTLYPPAEQCGKAMIGFAVADCCLSVGPMDDGHEGYEYRAEFMGAIRIQSKKTGKYIYLHADELLSLAIARGIDDDEPIPFPGDDEDG